MSRSDHAAIAALSLSGACTLAGAAVMPLAFQYRPNQLGIVSPATMLAYPLQKETFWYVAAIGIGTILAFVLAARLQRQYSTAHGVALEVVGVSTLVGALSVGTTGLRFVIAGAGLLAAAALARAGRRVARIDAPAALAPEPRRARLRGLIWLGLYALTAVAVVGWAPAAVRETTIPDSILARPHWPFMAEDGQHLAWAHIVYEGGFQGRDFFSLYGPYYDLGVVALWKLFGPSVGIWWAYQTGGLVVGTFASLVLAGMLCRHRAAALLIPVVALPTYVRYGWGLFGLACLLAWLQARQRGNDRIARWAIAGAGAVGGIAVLFSQEFGFAYLVCAGLVLLVTADRRAMLRFGVGVAATVSPLVLWYASRGALGPLLFDLVAYPSYLMAGFGKIPFPDLVASLPLNLFRYPPPESYLIRVGYAVPAICVGGVVLALWVALDRPLPAFGRLRAAREALVAHPAALVLAVTAVYGLLAFRSALGRSDLGHLSTVLGVPGILLAVGVDRAFTLVRDRRVFLGLWRAAALIFVMGAGAMSAWAEPVVGVRRTLEGLSAMTADDTGLPDEEVDGVRRWIVEHTTPEDRVYFLPNNAAYHFLTRRRGPTRWVVSHQMVTDAHRAEAMAALRAAPPRFVVYDPTMSGLDGIPDSVIFGGDMLDWLEEGWIEEARFGDVSILRPLRAGETPCPRPPPGPPRPFHAPRQGCR
jgi:hypothetical protein